MEEKELIKNQTNEKMIEGETRKSTLLPKNDVVFQTLFTRGTDNITKALLEDILKIKINKIDLDKSKDLVNDNMRSKNGRLDVRAELNGNIDCDIEMQLVPHEKMIERFLYYWAKMYTANIKQGEGYSTLKKAISIIIVDAEIPLLEKIPKAHTEWRIMERNSEEIVLTEHFEMHIIVIPKAVKEYKNNKKDEVLQWMMFLNNPENSEVSEIMKINDDIKEAKVELEKISQDEKIRRAALNEEIARRDYEQGMYDATQRGIKQGIEQGKRQGIEQGKKQGIEEGVKQGKENERKKIIKKLSSMGMSVTDIADAVGLTETEITKSLNEK